MVAAQAVGPTRPPANIEDFLWNMHSTLVATPGPLSLEQLKEAYSKHLGHKCAIERFLVVGEGGLGATLKRIPHIVTLFQEGGNTCVRATQAADINKQQLIEADQQYRRELLKKNAAAKAKAAPGAKAATAPAPKAAAGAAAPTGGAAEPAKAAATPSPVAEQAKRPAEGQAPAPDAKKPRADSDADTLARMLVQGVVRVLQNRLKAGKGALPLAELEDEFKALWKVPFNLQQAGEQDAVTFLQKWPNKVELVQDGAQTLVQLPKKVMEKAKAGDAPPTAAKGGATAGQAPAAVPPAAAAAGAAKAVPAKPVAAAGAAAVSAKPPAAAKAPVAAGTAAKSPSVGTGAKAPAPPAAVAAANGGNGAAEAAAKTGPSGGPKRAGGGAGCPSRPPASIEDFLWNIHSVIDAFGGPMPLDQLKEAYSKHLGHKCAIERFLVVGEGGLAATLKRIPHVVVVSADKDGNVSLKAALPSGTTREQLIAADHSYRKQLQQKNVAAKAAAAQSLAKTAPAGAAPAAGAAPPAAAAAPAAAANAAPATSPAAPAAAKPAAAAAPAATAGEKRPADGAAAGEAAAKKPRPEDADTLARMLVQGIVRVLQNRQRDGKGPLPVASLEEEFKALWKVPFNLAQAGETDAVTFLQKWPNKVEVITDGAQPVVQLAKKAAEKAKAAPAAVKAAAPAGAAEAPAAETQASKAAPAVSASAPAKTGVETTSPAPAAAVPTAASGLAASASPAAAAPAAAPTAAAAPAQTGAAAAGRSAAASPKEAGKAARASPRSGERDDEPTPGTSGAAAAAEESTSIEGSEAAVLAGSEASALTLPEVQREAESVLQVMQDMCRRQEAVVGALRRLSAERAASK